MLKPGRHKIRNTCPLLQSAPNAPRRPRAPWPGRPPPDCTSQRATQRRPPKANGPRARMDDAPTSPWKAPTWRNGRTTLATGDPAKAQSACARPASQGGPGLLRRPPAAEATTTGRGSDDHNKRNANRRVRNAQHNVATPSRADPLRARSWRTPRAIIASGGNGPLNGLQVVNRRARARAPRRHSSAEQPDELDFRQVTPPLRSESRTTKRVRARAARISRQSCHAGPNPSGGSNHRPAVQAGPQGCGGRNRPPPDMGAWVALQRYRHQRRPPTTSMQCPPKPIRPKDVVLAPDQGRPAPMSGGC